MYSIEEVLKENSIKDSMEIYLEEFKILELCFEQKLRKLEEFQEKIKTFVGDVKGLLSFENTYKNIRDFTKNILEKQEVKIIPII